MHLLIMSNRELRSKLEQHLENERVEENYANNVVNIDEDEIDVDEIDVDEIDEDEY